jgi:DNA-binding NtrC family response regulator
MLEVMDMVRQIAPARSTVLLTGESGTGKELIAHALHQLSPRAGKPFIAVHCAALNSSLLESELFGHEKGAFTGAHARQQGRFERANGGTIFLDEVGEVDPATQVKLLRVLESRSFERVGGGDTLEVDVRVITATNRDLKGMVEAGTFREDLYYRLAVMHIHLPALRERIADLPLLLNYFLSRFCEENAKKLNGFSKEALKVLSAYAWPGNIRELRNCVERMVVMARGTSLTLSDVPREIRTAVAESLPAQASPGTADTVSAVDDAPLQRSGTPTADASGSLDMEQAARQLIIQALKECDGNRTLAARKLGISRRTLHRKINIYGLGDL